MIKIRIFPENNYKAIWFNNKTIRTYVDSTKPITKLKFPEFYDIKITSKCFGNCEWCYMDSKSNDKNTLDILDKIENYFRPMSKNERPFQVAIGGGEPTEHPDFISFIKKLREFDIVPNYTTNGMWVDLTDFTAEMSDLLLATKTYCGGVALSCHPHLENYWKVATALYLKQNIRLNFHIIISDSNSIDYFIKIYEEYKDKIDYFVLLPYENQGRAKNKDLNWDYLVTKMPKNTEKIAFGANFYPYLQKGPDFGASLYEPEMLSGFLDLQDMKLYESSFNLTEKKHCNT